MIFCLKKPIVYHRDPFYISKGVSNLKGEMHFLSIKSPFFNHQSNEQFYVCNKLDKSCAALANNERALIKKSIGNFLAMHFKAEALDHHLEIPRSPLLN